MIKSWTDTKGVEHYADEHSKAYRNRDEAKPERTVAPKPVETPKVQKPEGK